MHHLLFTLFHVDLQTKLEAPKPVSLFICSLFHLIFFLYFFIPAIMVGSLGLLFNSVELIILVNFSQVVIGYAALPLSSHAQYVLLI